MTHHDPLTIAREALEPFARHADEHDDHEHDDNGFSSFVVNSEPRVVSKVTIGDLRRAREALAALTQASTHSEEGRTHDA